MENAPIIKKELQGGTGGGVRDMDPRGITRIDRISIRHSEVIDALIVCFESNGTKQCTEQWGGKGGIMTEINLKENEYIKSVKGCAGQYYNEFVVRSLVLKTNLAVYGPYGHEVGKTFKFLAPPGGQIIGFHARSGWNIDALGVYVWGFPKKPVLYCCGGDMSENDMDFAEVTGIVNDINTGDSNPIEVNTGDSNPIDIDNCDSNPIDVNTGDSNPIDINTGDSNPIDAHSGSSDPNGTLFSDKNTGGITKVTGPIIKKELCGGPGGSVKDTDPTGITRIVKITIRHSEAVDALIVCFERNGTMECTDQWGGNGGSTSEINFETNEYITSVNGYMSDFHNGYTVRSLLLETNLAIYGPYGTESRDRFELPALGDRIIGFHGRSSEYLNAVGVYIQGVIRKLVLCGGDGGSPRDMNLIGVTRIVKVSIHHSDAIDGLSICFDREGTTEHTSLWGRNTGVLDGINLKRNEYIKSVRGYFGYMGEIFVVRSLELITNLANTYGPFGKEKGTPFELSAFGGQIIGFHRLSGAYLDAIGVYVLWPEK